MLVYVWANNHAFVERNWLMYASQTNSQVTYDSIYYASDTGYDVMGGA